MHILVQYANELRQARVGPRVWWQDKSRRNTLTSVKYQRKTKWEHVSAFWSWLPAFDFCLFGYFSFGYFIEPNIKGSQNESTSLLSGLDCQLLIFVYVDIWIFQQNETASLLSGPDCQLWLFHPWTRPCMASICSSVNSVCSSSIFGSDFDFHSHGQHLLFLGSILFHPSCPSCIIAILAQNIFQLSCFWF